MYKDENPHWNKFKRTRKHTKKYVGRCPKCGKELKASPVGHCVWCNITFLWTTGEIIKGEV